MNTTWKKMAPSGRWHRVSIVSRLWLLWHQLCTKRNPNIASGSSAEPTEWQRLFHLESISRHAPRGGRHGFSHAVIAEALGMTEMNLHSQAGWQDRR